MSSTDHLQSSHGPGSFEIMDTAADTATLLINALSTKQLVSFRYAGHDRVVRIEKFTESARFKDFDVLCTEVLKDGRVSSSTKIFKLSRMDQIRWSSVVEKAKTKFAYLAEAVKL